MPTPTDLRLLFKAVFPRERESKTRAKSRVDRASTSIRALPLPSFYDGVSSKELPTVSEIDLSRYMGVWREVARIPRWFEKGCYKTEAEYTLQKNGTIQVENRCWNGKGRKYSVRGIAWVPDSTHPGRLRVQFFWPLSASYWILQLDPDYRWVLVGTPNRKGLWFLSRDGQIDPFRYAELVAWSQAMGFPVEQIEKANLTPPERKSETGVRSYQDRDSSSDSRPSSLSHKRPNTGLSISDLKKTIKDLIQRLDALEGRKSIVDSITMRQSSDNEIVSLREMIERARSRLELLDDSGSDEDSDMETRVLITDRTSPLQPNVLTAYFLLHVWSDSELDERGESGHTLRSFLQEHVPGTTWRNARREIQIAENDSLIFDRGNSQYVYKPYSKEVDEERFVHIRFLFMEIPYAVQPRSVILREWSENVLAQRCRYTGVTLRRFLRECNVGDTWSSETIQIGCAERSGTTFTHQGRRWRYRGNDFSVELLLEDRNMVWDNSQDQWVRPEHSSSSLSENEEQRLPASEVALFVTTFSASQKENPCSEKPMNKSDQCAICLRRLKQNPDQSSESEDQDVPELCCTQCNHTFHKQCIIEWLTRKNTCPQCRHVIYEL